MKTYIEKIIIDLHNWQKSPIKLPPVPVEFKVYQNGPIASAIIEHLYNIMAKLDAAYSIENFDEQAAAEAISEVKLLMAGELKMPEPPKPKKVKLLHEL